MEKKILYRVKREGLEGWAPQYWEVVPSENLERVPIFAIGSVSGWRDFYEDGKRVTCDSDEEAEGYIERKKAEENKQ